MEEIQLVVLETEELEEQHAYASLGILSHSNFSWEESNLKFLVSKLLKTKNLLIDVLMMNELVVQC